MIKIVFLGQLSEDLNLKQIELHCSTFREAVRAIEINTNGEFTRLLRKYADDKVYYTCKIDDSSIDLEFLGGGQDQNIDGMTVYFIPKNDQAGDPVTWMIVMTIISIALQLVSMLLTKSPTTETGSADQSVSRKKENYLFDGKGRPISQGNPVPVGYGRMMAPSMAINTFAKYRDSIGSSMQGDPYYYSFRLPDADSIHDWILAEIDDLLEPEWKEYICTRDYKRPCPYEFHKGSSKFQNLHDDFVNYFFDKEYCQCPIFGKGRWGTFVTLNDMAGGWYGDGNGKGDRWFVPCYQPGKYLRGQTLQEWTQFYTSSLRSEQVYRTHGNDGARQAYGYQAFVVMPRFNQDQEGVIQDYQDSNKVIVGTQHSYARQTYRQDEYQRQMMAVYRVFTSQKTNMPWAAPANFRISLKFYQAFSTFNYSGYVTQTQNIFPNNYATIVAYGPGAFVQIQDEKRKSGIKIYPLDWEVTLDFNDFQKDGRLTGIEKEKLKKRLASQFNQLIQQENRIKQELLNFNRFNQNVYGKFEGPELGDVMYGHAAFCIISIIPQYKKSIPTTKTDSLTSFHTLDQTLQPFKNHITFVSGIETDSDGKPTNIEDSELTMENMEYDCLEALYASDDQKAQYIDENGEQEEQFLQGKFVSYYVDNGGGGIKRALSKRPSDSPSQPMFPSKSFQVEQESFFQLLFNQPEIGRSDQING